jgi:hypothetical protein
MRMASPGNGSTNGNDERLLRSEQTSAEGVTMHPEASPRHAPEVS